MSLFRPVLVSLFLTALFIAANAQKRSGTADEGNSLISAGSYPMTVLDGWPLEDMSAGTTQLIGPSTDNDNSALSPIGFTFRMDNADYTTFGASGNGFMVLGRATLGTATFNNLSQAGIDNPKVVPFWDNLCVGSNGKVHYKTVGSPGTRKLVVEWQNMQITRNGACSGPGTGTFQVWLLETTGVIQFVYGNGMTETASVDGGYSVGISSTTGPMQTFATITTASNTVGYQVPNNSQTSAIPAGKSYVFTPNVPPAPSGGNVTALTLTSLQLNWTDNASNEMFYQVRRSTDNVNFTIIATLNPNSTSFADSGLEPSTQYFYHVNALSEGALSQDLAITVTTPAPGNAVSTAAGGLWSSPATWASGVVPGAGDNVTIADGAQVTVDIAAAAFNLTVGTSGALAEPDEKQAGAAPAALTFEETAAHSLTVERNVLIKSNGTFATSGLGNVTGHVLSVGGDLTNNGDLDLSTNNNQAGANITFTGRRNSIFGGSGAVTDIRQITLNKVTPGTNTTELNPANFTVQGSATETPASGFLQINNGIFKISGTFTGTHRTFASSNYFVPPSGGIWLNNPNYTVVGQNGTAMVEGFLRVTAGTFNAGIVTGNSIAFRNGSSAIIEGGAVNVAGGFGVFIFAPVIWHYTQTGGTLTSCTSTSNSNTCFDAGDEPGSTINISGGNIVIQNQSNMAYRNELFTGSSVISGGTVTFGNAATAGAAVFNVSGSMPNMVIDNSAGGHTVSCQQGISARDVLINPGTTLNLNTRNLGVTGTSFVNNGTLTANGSNVVVQFFNPNAHQTYSGSGVSTGAITRLIVYNQSLTLDPAINNIRVRYITMFRGDIVNANKLTIGNNDATTSVIQFGDFNATEPAGTFDTAPGFDLGTGGESVMYLRTGAIRTTGPEINPARTLAALAYDNNDPATDELNIAGGDLTVTGTLFLNNGEIKTGANKLIHQGPASRVNGYVNGTISRTFTSPNDYVYHVGVNGYSPAALFMLGSSVPPTTVTVKAVDAVLPGIDPAVSATRSWETTESANTIHGRWEFVYTDADIVGDESTYAVWGSQGGGTPTQQAGTNNPATNRVISGQPLSSMGGNWGIGHFAQPRSIGGLVRTSNGQPIRNATLVLSGGGLPAPRVTQTGSFGTYTFDNVLTGTQYNLFVSAKRFRFSPPSQIVVILSDDFNINFVANP